MLQELWFDHREITLLDSLLLQEETRRKPAIFVEVLLEENSAGRKF
jgi:hypothetical protein